MGDSHPSAPFHTFHHRVPGLSADPGQGSSTNDFLCHRAGDSGWVVHKLGAGDSQHEMDGYSWVLDPMAGDDQDWQQFLAPSFQTGPDMHYGDLYGTVLSGFSGQPPAGGQVLPPTSMNGQFTAAAPAPAASVNSGDSQIVILVNNGALDLPDGFSWLKYGSKGIKNKMYKRAYFKCADQACEAKKRAEQSSDNPNEFIFTYLGKHNHAIENE